MRGPIHSTTRVIEKEEISSFDSAEFVFSHVEIFELDDCFDHLVAPNGQRTILYAK